MMLYDIREEAFTQSSDIALYNCFIKVTEDIDSLCFLASLIPESSFEEEFNQIDSFRKLFVKLIACVDTDFRALQQSYYNSQSC